MKLTLGMIVAPFAIMTAEVNADEKGLLHFLHDGPTSFSVRGMSFSGVGKTEFKREDFVLTVQGQFRMQGSARVVSMSLQEDKKKFRADPEWVSLVALGTVTLELTGERPRRIRAAKAVYLFVEDRWLIDDKDLH